MSRKLYCSISTLLESKFLKTIRQSVHRIQQNQLCLFYIEKLSDFLQTYCFMFDFASFAFLYFFLCASVNPKDIIMNTQFYI